MDATTQDILLVGGFFLALSVIPIVLQVWLSIREKKWLACILPALSFLFALNATYTSYASDASMGTVVLVFVLFNLLTVALGVTAWICFTVQQRREAKAAAKDEKAKVRAEKDAVRTTIELK